MRLGAHESVAGGLVNAFRSGDGHGSEAIQIFTTNGSRWAPQPRDPGEIREFAGEAGRRRVPLLAHDSYLINLASVETELREKSRRAFLAELERCEELGVGGVVLHPGAHMGAGVDVGLARAAKALAWAIRRTRGWKVRVIIELTAGQGTCLGHTFEEIATLLDRIGEPERTGVCFDTCHALAAGYDLRTPAGYARVWREFDELIGLSQLRAFHLNDSHRDLGARVDRHAPIGEGFLGDAFFRRLVRDERFAGVPAVLELPPEVVPGNLDKLRRFRGKRHTWA